MGLVLMGVLACAGVLVWRVVGVLARVVEGYQVPNVGVEPPDLGVEPPVLRVGAPILDPTDGIIPEMRGGVGVFDLPYVDPWSIDPTFEPVPPESVMDAPVFEDGSVDLGVSYPKLSELGRNEGMME